MIRTTDAHTATDFFSISFSLVQGQDDILIDLPISNASFGFDIIPLDTAGFYTIERLTEVESQMRVKKGFHYDKNFVLKDTFALEVDERFRLYRWTSDANGAYFLYEERILRNEIGVMHISPEGKVNFKSAKLANDFIIQHFDMIGKNALIGGVFGSKPIFFIFDLEQATFKTLPGILNDRSLEQSIVDKRNNLITIVASLKTNVPDQFTYEIKNYDFEGSLLRELQIKPSEGRSLLSVSVSNFLGESQFVFGVYREVKKHGSTGVYSVKIAANGTQEQRYIPYLEISDIYNHLPEAQVQSLIEKTKRTNEKTGKSFAPFIPTVYSPKLGVNHVFYALGMSFGPKASHYVMVMNTQNQIVNTSNVGKIVHRLGVSWMFNNQFYHSYRVSGTVYSQIINDNQVRKLNRTIPRVDQQSALMYLEEKIFSWYGNKVLVATIESRGVNEGDVERHMVITEVTID